MIYDAIATLAVIIAVLLPIAIVALLTRSTPRPSRRLTSEHFEEP